MKNTTMAVPAQVSLTPAQLSFLHWLRSYNPTLYAQAVDSANRSVARGSRGMLSGLGSWWSSLTSAVSSIGSAVAGAAGTVAPALLQYQTQKKVLGVQLARAQQGLQPLDMSQLSMPAYQLQVSPSAQTLSTLGTSISSGTNKVLLYGGLALLAGLGLWFMTKRHA